MSKEKQLYALGKTSIKEILDFIDIVPETPPPYMS